MSLLNNYACANKNDFKHMLSLPFSPELDSICLPPYQLNKHTYSQKRTHMHLKCETVCYFNIIKGCVLHKFKAIAGACALIKVKT